MDNHKLKNGNQIRKEKKSKCIKESILQLKTNSNSQLLIDKFNNQDEKCFWCNCKLECPKLDDTSYENNYNTASLDRIDNDNKHHTIDNVNITCIMCNFLRNATHYNHWNVINNILLGKSDTLDLSNINMQNKFSSKRRTIDSNWREWINENNYKDLICPISGFPIIFSEIKWYPLLPSWDRIINNDKQLNKMGHEKENVKLTSLFVNRGRNSINHLEDFIRIFNEKFPNRCMDIKVIYPKDYEYIEISNCFLKKSYYDELLNDPYKGCPGRGVKHGPKLRLKNTIKKILLYIHKILIIRDFVIKNGGEPSHKNGALELKLYRILSDIKQTKILNEQLKIIGIKNTDTQKEKHDDDWWEMYNKLVNYIDINGTLPINTCEDKKLYGWVSTQKKKFKKENLKQEYIDELNKIELWWWTEIHQGYLRNKQWFILDNPNIIPPKKKFCMTEFNWYTKIKKFYLLPKDDKNCLTNYERALIKNIPIFQEWIKYEYPKRGDGKNYKEFYKKFQHSESIIKRDNKGRIMRK